MGIRLWAIRACRGIHPADQVCAYAGCAEMRPLPAYVAKVVQPRCRESILIFPQTSKLPATIHIGMVMSGIYLQAHV